MSTLERWKQLLHGPHTLVFPELQLMGHDFDPCLVEGRGELRLISPGTFEFTLRGKPEDPAYTRDQFLAQKRTPYDALARFRLFGTDQDGVRWALGWTVPEVDATREEWILTGRTHGITTVDQSPSVSEISSTELIFIVPPEHPLVRLMGTATPLAATHQYQTEILGSKIGFSYDTASQAFSIIANHSDALPPTYTENWLGEPLRILFGQLIYPRLVARNLGNRRSHVSVHATHVLSTKTTWAALLGTENVLDVEHSFWRRYEELLILIARARDKEGNPNFEANKITRLYEEIIQATYGSRWVWALTFGSSIEALANMLGMTGAPRSDVSPATRQKLIDHITDLSTDQDDERKTLNRLKASAINAVSRASQLSLSDVLRGLVSNKVLTQRQYDAWDALRNSVMHGSLVSPYSSEEEDGKLLALLEMMHALTLEVLKSSIATR